MAEALLFRDALIAALGAVGDRELVPFVAAIEAIDIAAPRRSAAPRLTHPAMSYLSEAAASLADARFAASTDALDWGQVFEGGGIETSLAEGMLAAQFAGSYGRFASDTMATGLFLLAPGIRYPLHTHSAGEVYYCLSGQLRLQHGIEGNPFDLERGEHSITPPHRLHALETCAAPVLLAYVWTGDLSGANWWWSRGETGWQRTAWRRNPGEPWRPGNVEAVTPEIMAQAHG